MKNFKGLLKNKKGQSEVVAVLVLVAVVIVGAIGVGVIMNGFSNQVASTASADGISDGAATELLTAGSTTLQPLSECLGKVFMKDNKGVRVTVQGGGSSAGIAATGMDVVDLGAASKDVSASDLTKYPTIQTHKVGGSGVVVIGSAGCAATATNATTKSQLANCYANGTATCTLYNGTATATVTVGKIFDRSEASGTEETFAAYLGSPLVGSDKQLISKAEGKTGNQGVLDAVKGYTGCAIGFVDYGFTVGAGVTVLNVTDYTDAGNYAGTSTNILAALKATAGTNTGYPNDASRGLIRPLNYLTNGAPSVLEGKFIDFASAPGDKTALGTAANCFTETGYFAAWEFAL